MIWIWLGVVISLLLIEYMSRNFTAICFAISGIVACIMTEYQEKYNMQLIVFLVVGIFLILMIRPVLLKWLQKKRKIEEISPIVTIICFFISGIVTCIFAPMSDYYRIGLAIILGFAFVALTVIWTILFRRNRGKEKKEDPLPLKKEEKIEKKPVVSSEKPVSKKKKKKKKKK